MVKGLVLFTGAFGCGFESSAGATDLCRGMTGKEERVNVLVGVKVPVLMEGICLPCKAHGGKSVILRDYHITCGNQIHQSKIHTVCAFGADQSARALALDSVCGVAQNRAGQGKGFAKCDRFVYDGTTVRINVYLHKNTPFLPLF